MFDAIVLAGGAGRRLGGVDKPGLLVGSVSLLDRVLLACAAAETTVVVGPERPTVRPVHWTREEPAGGGPAAALAAGLGVVSSDLTLVLAADLPFLTGSYVEGLVGSLRPEYDGHVACADGQPQWLCGIWRTAALLAGVAGKELADAPLRRVVEGLSLSFGGRDGSALPEPWDDVDTEADLARAREQWA